MLSFASVELWTPAIFSTFSPLYNKKTAKPLVYTNVPIQAYTLGVLRAVLVALTNVYDGKKRTYVRTHVFFGILSTYLYIGPGRINAYVTILHQQDYHLQNRVCKRYFLTVISVTSLSTCSAARANNYFIHKQWRMQDGRQGGWNNRDVDLREDLIVIWDFCYSDLGVISCSWGGCPSPP